MTGMTVDALLEILTVQRGSDLVVLDLDIELYGALGMFTGARPARVSQGVLFKRFESLDADGMVDAAYRGRACVEADGADVVALAATLRPRVCRLLESKTGDARQRRMKAEGFDRLAAHLDEDVARDLADHLGRPLLGVGTDTGGAGQAGSSQAPDRLRRRRCR